MWCKLISSLIEWKIINTLSHWKFFSFYSFKFNIFKIFTYFFLSTPRFISFLIWNLVLLFCIQRKKKEKIITFLLIKKRTNKTSKIKAKIPTVTPTPIPIACPLWFSCDAPKLHVIPSPEYPVLHAQLKLPGVFVQSELISHSPLFVWHSLISIYYLCSTQISNTKKKSNQHKRIHLLNIQFYMYK